MRVYNVKFHPNFRQKSAPIPPPSPALSEELVGDTIIDTNLDNPDWAFDPNEPRYCICNQVSYGDMVACDNAEVNKIYQWSQNIFPLQKFLI